METIPIATILSLLTTQITKTAQAAKDVIFEKESFKTLAKHLLDIQPVLKELQQQKINNSPATIQALEFLEADVKKANNLVEKYKSRARFYLLVKCRNIVKEVQDVKRDIGKSLAALSLANTEVLSRISEQVNRLQNEMQRAEFEASQSRLQIVEKLDQGLVDQRQDNGFANDILTEIAWAVGVPVEPSEISKELEDLRREKEEAADRKERAEVFYLEQVIQLLSRADAAIDYEEVKKQYFQRLQVIEGYKPKKEYIEPFKAFNCCITGAVMVDPVSLCTGTACERSALEAWFESGKKTDPATGDALEDLSYRSNVKLRQSIQEWKELNYCLKIRSCKKKLLSELDLSVEEALEQMLELVRDNSINKDWISLGGLTEIIISMLGNSQNENLKEKILVTMQAIVEGHAKNKELLADSVGFDYVIQCLGHDSNMSKIAIDLIYELIQERSGWNLSRCKRFSQQQNSILFLVNLLRSPTEASAEKARKILMKLCDDDEDSIIQAAKANYYEPLINRIIQGPASLRISMVRALLSLDLLESNVKLLGVEGMLPHLLNMLSGNVDSKEMSLSALVLLLTCNENKKLIADAGGVPLILELLFSSQIRTIIIAKCAQIVEKLVSDGHGVKFLVDEKGTQLELEPIVTNLLAFQQNINSSDIVRRPSLRALLGICQDDAAIVKTAVLKANGVSLVLPLIDDIDPGTREVAINLLFLFSQHEPEGVAEYLLKPRRLEALVGFLRDNDKSDLQMATAGLLANLPKSEMLLTEKLIELGGLKAIINILESGTTEAKENALSALFRFTDPTNLDSQRIVVELGAYPLLANFLRVGSVTAKARAAALIGDLSMRTPELTVMSNGVGCMCFRRTHLPLCPAHGGVCSVATTFCLLEAKVLPELIALLNGEIHATAYEAIQTLSTLVQEESPYRGANVLHQANAIGLVLEVMTWGSDSLKEEALRLLEKVFMSKEMVDLYGITARLPLVRLTGRIINYEQGGRLQRKAARVLLLIERYSRSSRSFASGMAI